LLYTSIHTYYTYSMFFRYFYDSLDNASGLPPCLLLNSFHFIITYYYASDQLIQQLGALILPYSRYYQLQYQPIVFSLLMASESQYAALPQLANNHFVSSAVEPEFDDQ